MKYLLNYRGVKVHCDGDPDSIKDEIHKAWLELQNLNRINTSELKHASKPGHWFIRNYFGKEEIFIRAKPGLVVPEKKKRIVRRPVVSYIPAHHTYNSDDEWIGLTLNMTGKWGPPYVFFAVPESSVWTFSYGRWNVWRPAPPEENYVDRPIAEIHAGSVESMTDEIAADHQYTSEIEWDDTVNIDSSSWLGSPTMMLCCCTNDIGKVTTIRDYVFSQENKYPIFDKIVTDWYEYTLVPVYEYGYSDLYYGDATGELWLCSVYHYDPNPSNACAWAVDWWNAHVADVMDEPAPLTHSGTHYVNSWEYDYLTVSDGYEPAMVYSTYDGLTPDRGFAITGGSYYNEYGQHRTKVKQCTCGDSIVDTDTETYGTYYGIDYAMVFGELYELRTFPGEWYYEADDYIYTAEPRIYNVDSAPKYALASLNRVTYVEYICFCLDAGIAQYNDPVAIYQKADGTSSYERKHLLPITVSGEQVYGNGEFSLLRLTDWIEEEVQE